MTQSKKQALAQWEQRQEQKQNNSIELGNITYGRDIAKPCDIITTSLLNVEAEIRSGKHQRLISKVRDYYSCYQFGLQDEGNSPKFIAELKSNYQTAKSKLPWFSLSIFDGRRSAATVKAIYGIILDFDEIRDAEHFKERVRDNITEAHLVFISPSGMGVKCLYLFKVPMLVNDANRAQVTEDYKYVYAYLLAKVENSLGVIGDHSTNDISRVCYLAHDPFMFKRNAYVDWREILTTKNTIVGTGVPPVLNKELDSRLRGNDNTIEEDFERAREVVSKLAQIRFDYRDYIKVGMSLYDRFGDRGKELWMLLLDNPNYNDTAKMMDIHWKSFRSVNSVKLASLYYVGAKYGCV